MTDSPSTEPDPQPEAPALSHASLAAAISAFQGDMPVVKKTKTAKVQTKSGRDYQYTYADLADIVQLAGPILARHGLSHTCKTKFHPALGWVLVGRLRHVFGEEDRAMLPITVASPQETGSALTYARRYLLGIQTGIVTDDDDDGNVAQTGARERQDDHQRERHQQAPQVDPAVHARRLLANADPATVDALRLEALGVCDEAPPGEARDLGLRALYSKVDQAEALGSVVELPEAWRRGDVALVPLWELINGARTITIPSGETTQPAQDAPGEAQDGPAADPGQQETAQEPDAAQGAVQRARAQADRQHAERSSEPMEEDPWATTKA